MQGNFSENFAVANETSVENIFTVPMDPVAYPDAKDYNVVRTAIMIMLRLTANPDGMALALGEGDERV